MSLTETCKRETEITVPVEEIEKETAHVVAGIAAKAKLPGFRPGKAPASLIRTRFKQEVRQELLEHVVPKAFRAKADAEKWNVVGTPNVVDLQFHEGEPLRFKAEFEVAPEFELGDYRGLELPYAEPQVAEEDVDKRLADLQKRKAEFVNEDPRPLVEGDYALISLQTIAGVEGEPIKNDGMSIHLGDPDTLPEFNQNLVGVSPDESAEFDVTYPADYGQERLSGRTVTFRATVKTVRREELPEINDEFARDLGDYSGLTELRDAIRGSIRAERESVAQQESKQKAIEKLVDAHPFAIPEAFLDRQIENQIDRQLREMAGQGMDPKELAKRIDWEKLKESRREAATRDVRASLLLERIADAESVHATNEEMDRELNVIAKREREPVAALRARFEKDGTLSRIAGHIRTEKTLNFLFEHARKVAPEPTPVVEAPASETPEVTE